MERSLNLEFFWCQNGRGKPEEKNKNLDAKIAPRGGMGNTQG